MTTKSEILKYKVAGQWMRALRSISIVLIGLVAQGSLAQTSTVLNFDSFADSTMITNQYQAQGVLAQGVVVSDASFLGLPAISGPNVAYAPAGLMRFDLSIANVQSISAYVSGASNVGIYGYDANNTLVASSVMASPGTNILLSATSSGAAITKVEIHDGGASFAVDDVIFTTAPDNVSCRSLSEEVYQLIAGLPSTAYVRAKTASLDRARLLLEVAAFEKLRASGKVSVKNLNKALSVIQSDVKASVKSPQNVPILDVLSEIGSMVNSNSCQ